MPFLVEIVNGSIGLRHVFEAAFQVRLQRGARAGRDIHDSIRDAVAVRFRPIVLTGLTTIFALIPAAMGWGSGPALLAPLGVFIAGGLLAGMPLTLNVLPVLYLSLERFRRRPIQDNDVKKVVAP